MATLNPKTPMKLIWGAFIGSLAMVLLASGGLQALQKAAIIAGAPLCHYHHHDGRVCV